MIQVQGIIGTQQGEYNLVKLIEAVKQQPQNTPIHITINSPGGDGNEAFAMYDYLRGLNRPIHTQAEGQCASAASILFLAGDHRTAGCPIMIHNPWMTAEGDSESLREAADWIEKFEKRCEKFYAEKTTLSEATISDLMKKETYLSPTQALSLNFATKAKKIAMALINNKQQKNNMSKQKNKGILAACAAFMTALSSDDNIPYMLEITDIDGNIVTINREEGEPKVGDLAEPDGTFVTTDGTTITVADGIITEILPGEAETETEVEQLKAENAQLKAQIANLRRTTKTADEAEQLNAVRIAGGKAWLAKQCSHYRPATRKASMTGRNETQETNHSRTSQKLAEARKKQSERGIK